MILDPSTDAGRRLLDDNAPEYNGPNNCTHSTTEFDRSICACGSMHDYCRNCGLSLGCPLGSPDFFANLRRSWAKAIVAIEDEAFTAERSRIKAVVKGLPILHLTGEQIGSIEPPLSGDWFMDFDEYEDYVPLESMVGAILLSRVVREPVLIGTTRTPMKRKHHDQ